MGSDSDLPTMRAAAEALQEFDIRCEVTVVSAHRTPDRMLAFARGAHTRGIKVRRWPPYSPPSHKRSLFLHCLPEGGQHSAAVWIDFPCCLLAC